MESEGDSVLVTSLVRGPVLPSWTPNKKRKVPRGPVPYRPESVQGR